jgi:predicted nucleotidyltransferase
MNKDAYTQADLALFSDLEKAAESVGIVPYLIGAGAISLGEQFKWGVRLPRATLDWDFAARVDSWDDYTRLTGTLTGQGGGFTSLDGLAHRFTHALGGSLDLIPFGALETPKGVIRWPNEVRMSTQGLEALSEAHENHPLQGTIVKTASLPAIVGLKLLAYADRRGRATYRDIGDVVSVLDGLEDSEDYSQLPDSLLGFMHDEVLLLANAGAYKLGQKMGHAFQGESKLAIQGVITLAQDRNDPAYTHAQLEHRNLEWQLFTNSMQALRYGIEHNNG